MSLPTATQTFAQEASSSEAKEADWSVLTNERIAVFKAALQLTPEQQKYWPAVEEAIRARAQTRETRLATMEESGSINNRFRSIPSNSCIGELTPWPNAAPASKNSLTHGSRSIKASIPTRSGG
jgi:hypothetical protein